MKKLVFMFVAMAAISFVSCNNTQKPATEVADSTQVEAVDTIAADTVATDTVAVDSVK